MANKRAGELHVSRAESMPSSPGSSSSASRASETPPSIEQRSQIRYQFLNFSHPTDAKDSRARKTVRSHVTRHQHRKENHPAATRRSRNTRRQPRDDEEFLETASTTRVHPATSPTERPNLTLPTQSSQKTDSSRTSSPSSSPTSPSSQSTAAVRLDPMMVYPQDWHPYIPGIIKHYLSVMAVDTPSLDGPDARGLLRTKLYPFCLSELASLHAVILLAATSHLGGVHSSRSHPIDILHLRGMAIGEVNKALANPVRATSDQIIVAVAYLASYEALFGDPRICYTHMTGLLRIVSLRGGLPALGLDGLLERFLLWTDSNTAHITGSRVYFDKGAFPSNKQHPQPDPQKFACGLLRRPPP